MKKLLGENDVEAILQRLDRLTLDEARTTAAQSLESIYGLVQNMRMVMDGEQVLLRISFTHRFVVQMEKQWQATSKRLLVRLSSDDLVRCV